MKLKDKVVIITGATSGIGAETAVECVKEGAKVVVVGRNAERGNAKVAELESMGGEAIFVPCDAVVEEDVKNVVETTVAKFGGIDVVVNNAGFFAPVPLDMHDTELWEKTFDCNMKSVFWMTKYSLPYVAERKGNYINMSSAAGLVYTDSGHAYGASKAALIHFTKQMAVTCGPQGVRVNAVCPGIIDTPIFGGADVSGVAAAFPMRRMGVPSEIAKPVVFLASEDASYITGAILSVDGGMAL